MVDCVLGKLRSWSVQYIHSEFPWWYEISGRMETSNLSICDKETRSGNGSVANYKPNPFFVHYRRYPLDVHHMMELHLSFHKVLVNTSVRRSLESGKEEEVLFLGQFVHLIWPHFTFSCSIIIRTSAQGQVFHCKLRYQCCNSAQRQVFHRKHRNQGCSFTRDE